MEKNINRFYKIAEMTYGEEKAPWIEIANGHSYGRNWFILDAGKYPIILIDAKGTKFEDKRSVSEISFNEEEPYVGKSYDDIPLDIHYGVDYIGPVGGHPYSTWFAFKYNHLGDYRPGCTSNIRHKWTTDELIKEAIDGAKKISELLKSDNRPVIINKISDTITEEIRLDGKTTVYDDLGNEEEMYTLIEKSYKLNVPLTPVCQEQTFDSLKKVQEMEYRLNMMRYTISTCHKAYGIGWDEHQPAVIVVQPITNKADLYWFEESDENNLWHERFSSLQSAYGYIYRQYGRSAVERWLTVNSHQSTNKKILSISDWLLRKA